MIVNYPYKEELHVEMDRDFETLPIEYQVLDECLRFATHSTTSYIDSHGHLAKPTPTLRT